METFHILYHKASGSIRVVREGLEMPKDYEKVDTIDHDPNESSQALENRVRTLVADKYPEQDIGTHTNIRIDDREPRGYEEDGKTMVNKSETQEYNDFGRIDPAEVDQAKAERHNQIADATPGGVDLDKGVSQEKSEKKTPRKTKK